MPVVKKRRHRRNLVKVLKLYFTITIISIIIALIYWYLTGDFLKLLGDIEQKIDKKSAEVDKIAERKKEEEIARETKKIETKYERSAEEADKIAERKKEEEIARETKKIERKYKWRPDYPLRFYQKQ